MKKTIKMPAHDPRYYFNVRVDSISDVLVVREIWCENVYEVFDGDLSDTGVVVDIGANIGAFSLYAAKLGAKKVIAVEPEPHNLELLHANIKDNAKNHDAKMIVEKRGVIGRQTSSTGYYITNDDGGSRIITGAEVRTGNYKDLTEVGFVTLDQLFKDHELEYIDVLKIDIEGLEGEVILGASQDTLNLCRYITMEYDQYSENLGAIVEKLSKTHQIKYVGSHGGMLFGKRY